jgi:hypothetical protein
MADVPRPVRKRAERQPGRLLHSTLPLNSRARASIEKHRLSGGPVNGGMAAGRPARAVTEIARMFDIANVNAAESGRRLGLGVTLEAQVRIALQEHFGINGAVRVVTDRAAFTRGRMLENERPRLLAMTLGASLILARHRQPARRFHDVHPVRIVALHAIHFAFDDRVMLRQMEFRPGFLVALEAGLRVFARVDDKFFKTTAARHGDVFAAGTVAGFAAVLAGHFDVGDPQPRVWAARKNAGNVRVTIKTCFVAHVGGPFNLHRGYHRTVCGAGV